MSETKSLLTSAIHRRTAFVFILIIFFGVQLQAVDGASLSGTVSDPTGAVIPGAAVVLSNIDTARLAARPLAMTARIHLLRCLLVTTASRSPAPDLSHARKVRLN